MVLYKEDHEMSREKRIEFTDPVVRRLPDHTVHLKT